MLDLGHICLSFGESVLCTLEFGIEFILVFKNSYSDYGKYCGPHYGAYLYTKNSGDNTVSAHFYQPTVKFRGPHCKLQYFYWIENSAFK